MKKALLLVNPKSGRQAAKTNFYSLVAALSEKYDVMVHFTKSSEDIVARAAECEFNTMIVCGGDGTLSNAVNGLMKNPRVSEIKLGYLPSGTANDVASTLEIPKTFSAAALYACMNSAKPHDIGKIGERNFVYTASFGTFTKTSYETSQDVKNVLGSFAYVLTGATELLNIKGYPIKVEYEGGVIEKDAVTFCGISNTRYLGGGLIKYPKGFVGLSDGKLEMLLVSKPKNIFDLENIVRSIASKEFNNEYVTLLQSSYYKVTSIQPIEWTVDGESGGEWQDVTVECVPSAVNFIRKEV